MLVYANYVVVEAKAIWYNVLMNEQKLPKLTRKQKIFVRELIENPKQSATSAAMIAYDAGSRDVAGSIASENLQKPQIMVHLQNASEKAEMALVEVLDYSTKYGKAGGKGGAAYASVAKATADAVLDRVHGKAVQRTEQVSTTVTIAIDLTRKDGEVIEA